MHYPGSKDDLIGANTVTRHLDKCVKAEQNDLPATQTSKN
jgi:hypothetical protein